MIGKDISLPVLLPTRQYIGDIAKVIARQQTRLEQNRNLRCP
ncbi:hypothetical protein [Aestuariivita sp.]|jgi:hypothetical protein|nr:hypothetical protein [Aestuariivita sp.]